MIYTFPNYSTSKGCGKYPTRNPNTIAKKALKNRGILIWDVMRQGNFVGSVQNDLIKKTK